MLCLCNILKVHILLLYIYSNSCLCVDARHALLAYLTTECQNLMLQFAIVRDALDSCSSTEEDEGGLQLYNYSLDMLN